MAGSSGASAFTALATVFGMSLELHVQENREAKLEDGGNAGRSVGGGEEFQAELHAAGICAHLLGEELRTLQAGRVDGDEDRVHSAETSSTVGSKSAGRLLPLEIPETLALP